MLQYLAVKNLAIVEEAEISFGAGLNVITGETGAGKSVLMGALELVLGSRAERSAIREGAAEASVEAHFLLTGVPELETLLSELELPPCEEGQLLVRRLVSAGGGGRCLVNDTPVTVSSLRRLGNLLVDVHGPYDHQSLLHQDFQRSVLDAYGQCAPAMREYAAAWRKLSGLEEELKLLQEDGADHESESELLRYTISEIKEADLSEADAEELVEQHAEAANAGEILTLGGTLSHTMMEGTPSVFDLLVAAQGQLGELARLLPEAQSWQNDARGIAAQLQELGRAIGDRLSRIEADPLHLERLEQRMALVQRLKRKYGGTLAAVLQRLEEAGERLHLLENRGEALNDLAQSITAARAELEQQALKLRACRSQAARSLAAAITAELRDLGFLHAGFAVEVLPATPAAHGADQISFGFAPNPGEPLRPLKSIASSGEISRVMLAVKAVVACHDSIPILVFDEIDSNIGGEVGSIVGEKLRYVARSHQVISITHLPQSAVYGERHFKVAKQVRSGRTLMRVERLDGDGRVAEIARMLGGQEITSVVKLHARELLLQAASGEERA